MDEVKGICIRNGLKTNHFNRYLGGKNKLGAEIDKHKYNKEKDWKVQQDLFEPMSSPHQEYIKMPVDVSFEFINTEELVSKL